MTLLWRACPMKIKHPFALAAPLVFLILKE